MKTPSRARVTRQPEGQEPENTEKTARVPVFTYLNAEQDAYIQELKAELGMTTSGVIRGLIDGAIRESAIGA
jgi:hypothetical protein